MRLIARYVKDLKDSYEVVTVYDGKIQREILSKKNPHLQSITNTHPSANWFERKIHDDFGIVIENSSDTRALVHQERFPLGIYPMRKSFKDKEINFSAYRPYDYEVVKGDGVFQVSVGPIHAGIIEPGHFHFSQAGEAMLHQEVRHFYKYRGIEKMLEGKTLFEAKPIIERISGNASVAYQLAWRDIVSQACDTQIPVTLQKWHALLLEMERIIHHLTDLGFIPNDAGFGAALAFCSRLSEEGRRVFYSISGHRFGFGSIGFEKNRFDKDMVEKWLDSLSKEIDFFQEWILDIPSLWDRFDTTGTLTHANALKYDSVGVVARASGIGIDRRENDFYHQFGFVKETHTSGDVAARFLLRIKEVKNSILMMKNFLDEDIGTFDLPPVKDGEYMSFAEGALGELFMAIDIKEGVIERFFVRDPSFMNWQVLHTMMLKDIIADFPLINKSCDLSYAGNDL